MTSTATGPTRSRALRAVAFAAVSVVIAALGHGAGHGAVPGSGTLAGAFAVALALGALVSRARWSAPRLLGGLAAVQAVVHGAAWVAAGSGGPADPRLEAVVTPATVHAQHAAPLTARMLLAHLVAVVVAAIVLAVIEQAAVIALAAARRLRPARRFVVPAVQRLAALPSSAFVALAAPHLVVVRSNAPPAARRI